MLGLLSLSIRARADETLYACGSYPNNVFYGSHAPGMGELETCGQVNGRMIIQTAGTNGGYANSSWQADAPAGLLIDQASFGVVDISPDHNNDGYDDAFFFGPGGSDQVVVGYPDNGLGPLNAGNEPGFPTGEIGFRMTCGASSCPNNGDYIGVGNVTFSVEETVGPSISGSGLWGASGWVRGTWPITVTGDSPSGICSLSASISGDPVVASGAMAPNETVWHQCNGSLVRSMNTAYAPDGADTLTISDSDAAGLSNSASTTVRVDNQAPTVSLGGPATALSTAGTQYVTVNVATGPSGAYGADCSVDGGPQTFYAGTTSQVPVSGIGAHTVTCTGLNNARDDNGQRASSAPESFTIDIQQPTVEAISFSKLADALKCRTVVKRIRVLGKPRTIRLHGHRVQVRRYRTVKRHVRRCRARTVKRRVFVVLKHHGEPVRRHGHIVRVRRTRRVVVLPHRVHRTVRHVRHGRGTTVSGLLLLADGTPLAGQTVTILGAPNNAAHPFVPISTATTDADGFWVAKIPAGPSRLLQAEYGGTATTAPAGSTLVRTIVPAKIRILSATPKVAWGQTATFRGRVYGGYVPRGGINVRLRYGYRNQSTTYGVKTHVGPRGRFTTTFTFGPGDPRDHIRFHFQFATLPGGNYPYHVATSNTVTVLVGGHPRPRRFGPHRHRHRKRGRRHHRRR
ncbi:MAG TPA: carboxypeptidase-like regulatory domain-containing protein [Solirubrobacteraceae bacterium]|nr:carboxypeptidase-like regulatory domain-containing protein [Solirubrobacteraceae bacterium]